MASYGLSHVDLATLDANLEGESINSSLIHSINSYLIGLGDTTGRSDPTLISVESGTPPFPVAQVLDVTSAGTFTIHTADGDQLVVVDDAGTDVRIEGHTSVLAVTGDGAGDGFQRTRVSTRSFRAMATVTRCGPRGSRLPSKPGVGTTTR